MLLSPSSFSPFISRVPAEEAATRRRRRRTKAASLGIGKTVTRAHAAGKEVYVHIDCDNVRPRFNGCSDNNNNNNAENNDATRFISAFYRCASAYGDVVSMTCYGNSSTFREEEEGRGEREEEEASLKKYRQSLGEALERVRIEGTDVRVVRTLSRRKQSADVRCVSDVVNAMRGGFDDDEDDENTPRKIAFIASKDAGLLKEAASAYVRKMGKLIICGDFINVGMREIDVHPIEAAYRELVEEKIGASGGGQRIKGRPASEALAIRSRLVAWKDPESVFFYASDDGDNGNVNKKNPMRKRRRREDPYLFMIPGPSSSEACKNDCVRGLPASIQPDMRDIIARYRKREENTNRINVKDDDNEEEKMQHLAFLYKLLKREAKKNLRVRSNPCFAHASEVLVYFDAGPKLGAVFAKWLENGDLEMLCR
jgi:hypothetical protein